jgi:hypothetical protein
VHDIRSRTTTTAPLALPAGTTVVQLTTDPDLAIVRTDRGIAVHSLTTAAEVRALSADTIVTEDGKYTVTCVSGGSTNILEPDELVVHDAASDAELRRIQLRSGCSLVRYTRNGRHALENLTENLGSQADSPAEANRIIELATGATYQFVGPDIDRAGGKDNTPVISALPTPGGGLDVFVAVGPSVLRIPAQREPLALDANYSPVATTFAPGGLLVKQDSAQQGRFTLNDTMTGMQIAERTTAASDGWMVDNGLWMLNHDDTNTHVDRYAFPDLSQTLRLAVPRRPDSQNTNAGTATDGTADTLVIGTDGTLTAFDTRTGRQLGDPVPVPTMRDSWLMWVRTDHPGEAIIA